MPLPLRRRRRGRRLAPGVLVVVIIGLVGVVVAVVLGVLAFARDEIERSWEPGVSHVHGWG